MYEYTVCTKLYVQWPWSFIQLDEFFFEAIRICQNKFEIGYKFSWSRKKKKKKKAWVLGYLVLLPFHENGVEIKQFILYNDTFDIINGAVTEF